MHTVTIAIVGSGGAGVVSLGEMLLKAAAKSGYFGLMRKSFGPQIRGGESAALLRLSSAPVGNFTNRIQLVLALDWNNFSRFGDEIPITPDTLVIQDEAAGQAPGGIGLASLQTLGFTSAADVAGSSKANMAMLGYLGAWLGCAPDQLAAIARERLGHFSEDIRNVSVRAIAEGSALFQASPLSLPLPAIDESVNAASRQRWIATGNQLAGLGALESGIRFVAAYPITPASDCLEWIARHIEPAGGHLVQAEDELAAINMAIGGGYAGVPSMTATSGPGLSLMCEAMGLAVSSETPVVILNVMRGGPSTGIPTKSEQSDLNLALYGMHGDAPHVVLSALSVEDCFFTLAWANYLAVQLQTLVIVLSDQFIGQSSQIIEPLEQVPFQVAHQAKSPATNAGFQRYALTESGISPMAVPGEEGAMYTADGLEHNEAGVPSPKAGDHQQQLDKRQRKLTGFDYGDHWASVHGQGDLVLLCWGSLLATALEAQKTLMSEQGLAVKVVAIRLLMPLPTDRLLAACDGARRIILVEQNHQAQCAAYLRSLDLPAFSFESYARPGPSLITPAEICDLFSGAGGPHEA